LTSISNDAPRSSTTTSGFIVPPSARFPLVIDGRSVGGRVASRSFARRRRRRRSTKHNDEFLPIAKPSSFVHRHDNFAPETVCRINEEQPTGKLFINKRLSNILFALFRRSVRWSTAHTTQLSRYCSPASVCRPLLQKWDVAPETLLINNCR
jgi:hypothetical protein